MKKRWFKKKFMSLQTLFHFLIAVGIIITAINRQGSYFVGIIITAIGGLGSYFSGQKESEKKDLKLEKKIDEIQKIHQVLLETTEGPKKEWNTINMIEVANWFPGEEIDYIYLIFKSSSKRIRGNLRIKDTDDIYTFSTEANATLPIAVRNLYLPEKAHFRKFPTIEYKINEKTDYNAILSIIMIVVHGVGERDVIWIEKPVKMTEK